MRMLAIAFAALIAASASASAAVSRDHDGDYVLKNGSQASHRMYRDDDKAATNGYTSQNASPNSGHMPKWVFKAYHGTVRAG